MAAWKTATFLLMLATPLAAHAQDGVDWGGLMQTEAMGSAMEEAAREGSPTQPTRRSTDASAAKARANCAKARGWVAEGVKHPQLPRAIALCRQLGY